jgi:hypothetical protein
LPRHAPKTSIDVREVSIFDLTPDDVGLVQPRLASPRQCHLARLNFFEIQASFGARATIAQITFGKVPGERIELPTNGYEVPGSPGDAGGCGPNGACPRRGSVIGAGFSAVP